MLYTLTNPHTLESLPSPPPPVLFFPLLLALPFSRSQAEFDEITGPRPLMTIPSVVSNQFNQDDFCLRIMAVDFQSQMGTKPDGVYAQPARTHSAPSPFLFIFYACLCPLERFTVVLRCTVLTIATLVVTLYLRRTCPAFMERNVEHGRFQHWWIPDYGRQPV